MEVKEYPRILYRGGVVEIHFHNNTYRKLYILTFDEMEGIKEILGNNYLNTTEEEFKRAYMAELL
jgi:hypothetical protein